MNRIKEKSTNKWLLGESIRLQSILPFRPEHGHVFGCLCFCVTSHLGCCFRAFTRSATPLLTSWGSAGFFIAQIWKGATAASTEDTRDAFWKPSECELLCHYMNASGTPSASDYVGIKGVSRCRLTGPVFHVCSLWIVKCVSTCFGCRVTGFKGRLIFSMGFFLFFRGRPLHAWTHRYLPMCRGISVLCIKWNT